MNKAYANSVINMHIKAVGNYDKNESSLSQNQFRRATINPQQESGLARCKTIGISTVASKSTKFFFLLFLIKLT